MKPVENNHSVKYLILVLVSAIFISETIIMLLLHNLPPLSEWQEALLDASLLSLLTFPVVYFMALQPLKDEINNQIQTKEELLTANNLLHDRDKEHEEKNYQLLKLNAALIESNERYSHLLDFSPVGYLVLTEKGEIVDINLTGEKLLGADKSKLINRNIDSFLPPEEIERWRTCRLKLKSATKAATATSHEKLPNKQSCKLIIQRDDGLVFYALLDCRRDDPLISSNIRVSFTDMTKQEWTSFQ